jgi:hypothetical protein
VERHQEVVEKRVDTYVAYPIGTKELSWVRANLQAAMADVRSAIYST